MVRIKRDVGFKVYDVFIVFPSHNGSDQTSQRRHIRLCWERVSIPQWFGSNIIHKALVNFHTEVSIPQWFGSNMTQKICWLSHLGFHPTMVRIKLFFTEFSVELLNRVSIPQWFGSNEYNDKIRGGDLSFHPTMVRIKHTYWKRMPRSL